MPCWPVSNAARLGGARLLAVVVEELDPFASDAIDVRSLVTHEPVGVGTDIRDADVVAEDDEDVRPLSGGSGQLALRLRRGGGGNGSQRCQGWQETCLREGYSAGSRFCLGQMPPMKARTHSPRL